MAQRAPLARYFFIASVVETTGKPQARATADVLGPCLARSPGRLRGAARVVLACARGLAACLAACAAARSGASRPRCAGCWRARRRL